MTALEASRQKDARRDAAGTLTAPPTAVTRESDLGMTEADPREVHRRAVDGWHRDTAEAVRRIDHFAQALGRALGEISRDEAVEALKWHAAEELERLR